MSSKTKPALFNFVETCLPFCIERQQDGRYVALNWRWKPVGFYTADQIKYENYPISVALPGMTPELAEKISCDGSRDLDCIYVYSGKCHPTKNEQFMQAYLKRLGLLANLIVH
jgi:hypothetical protein